MDLPKRKPTRLREYNYSTPGGYFVTICTHNRKNLFSRINVGAIHESPESTLTKYGEMVEMVIEHLPERFGIEIPKYVIMPNHIHLIITIPWTDEHMRSIHESTLQNKRSIVPTVIGYLKMNVSKMMHKTYPCPNIWQRSYHDHIIRGQKDYEEIWKYIDTNVSCWEKDCFYNK